MKVKLKLLNHVQPFGTPWPVALQALLSMGFFRQEYWSGSPFPFPEDLPNPEIEPGSPTLRQTFYPLSHEGSIIGKFIKTERTVVARSRGRNDGDLLLNEF